MFTGIIGGLATVRAITPLADGMEISLTNTFDRPVSLGDSVALDGVCTTVTELNGAQFTVQLLGSTLAVSTLGSVTVGQLLNWELSLTPSTPMGGHYVTGHVDEMGRIIRRVARGSWTQLGVSVSGRWMQWLVSKGSITLNGISLTVMAVGPAEFECHIVTHTMTHTTLSAAHVGQRVNVEYDILAKYLYNSSILKNRV